MLHRWGQNVNYHPTSIALCLAEVSHPDGRRWISCRPGFFLPVRVLSRLFRRLFLEELQAAYQRAD
ncbi:transposase [Mesorhizobium temperatum]|uniref:transposase n=1 Tax=Mesorhizobium temperatum TaxID=241416 RepID=UPI00142E8851|nr:transposase [Mesorhizobium temperatum]